MLIGLCVIIYILVTIGIALSRKVETDDVGYMFAGRKLTTPAFVMTLVATWYGGILEIGRFSYEYGVVTWLMFGIFYYFAAIFYSIFLVPKISSNNFNTIPDAFNKTYGKLTGVVAAIIIVFIVSPAPYLKILSTIIQHIYQINSFNAIMIACSISMFYTIRGGFGSVIGTDKFQFVLMYSGFALVLIFLYINYGGYEFLSSKLPPQKLSIPGSLNWSYIFVWGFIAMITFIDPNFYQRTFAGASRKSIQKGIYISVVLWFIFDLMSISIGLYAAAIIPEIQSSPYLDLSSKILPPILQAFFIISMLSIVMSTIDSFIFVSGFTIGKDILSSLIGQYEKNIYYTRIGIIITATISVILATFFKNALDIWYVMGSFGVSALFIPLLCILYNKRLTNPLLMLIIPTIITLGWFIQPLYPIDSMYPGLASSFICFLIFRK